MNKNDFKSFLKCASDCAWRTVSGSRFQAQSINQSSINHCLTWPKQQTARTT